MKRSLAASCLLVLVACQTSKEGTPKPTASSASASASSSSATPLARPAVDGGTHERGARLRALVLAWNAAINAHDADKLGALYADEIELYGQRVSRERAVAAKRAAFGGHVRDDISEIAVGDSGRATFHKRSELAKGRVIEVLGYLDEKDGKIVSEGDTTTDKNLARSKEVSCEDAVLVLVNTTAEAKKAAKEIEDGAKTMPERVTVGGMIMPPETPGAGWFVGVCENHPDRMPCYHRFNVDPVTAKVTYSSFGGDDQPVATDAALAAKVRAACSK